MAALEEATVQRVAEVVTSVVSSVIGIQIGKSTRGVYCASAPERTERKNIASCSDSYPWTAVTVATSVAASVSATVGASVASGAGPSAMSKSGGSMALVTQVMIVSASSYAVWLCA